MPHIKIANLGPIKNCEMDIENFTVLTGQQASGKSTIAKAIYFCRTVKDDILDEILKYKHSLLDKIFDTDIKSNIISALQYKFYQIFGSLFAVDTDINLEYYYAEKTFIKLNLSKAEQFENIKLKVIHIDFSNDIESYLKGIHGISSVKNKIKTELNRLFHDDYDSIFIPAGRSIITVLTSQLNYIFATMDDEQKRSIDYCTQKYIEYILKIKPLFSEGLRGLAQNLIYKSNSDDFDIEEYVDKEIKMNELIYKVLKGNYVYANGEERLYLANMHDKAGQYVKINFTSSGQQETVWLFNILFYLIANRTKAFIILEEPEAHLYPDAQKVTSELLALMSNCGCQLLITTHSPYILGAFNNLIYAEYLASYKNRSKEVEKLVDKIFRISCSTAYKVENGTIEKCVEDTPERLIINEVIDGASVDINQLYDKLFDIDMMDGE